MAKKFNSNLCIFIALVINFIIINLLKNESEISWSIKTMCGTKAKEYFDSIPSIQNNITNVILFQRAAFISSTILLIFVVGLSVFLISKDYKKTLISILAVIIINTIVIHILYGLILNVNLDLHSLGCSYNLLEGDGELKYNKLFYYYSKMPISNIIFTYLIASICISFIN